MKLSDIILENELERFSVSGQMKQTDNIVDQVAKAIAEKYDMKDDGMLRGTIRDAVITAKYDMDEEVNEVDTVKPEEIEISYTDYGKLYAIYFNGRKIGRDKGMAHINKLTGMDVPYSYDLKNLEQIKSKLQDQGIDADFNDAMDVS